MPARLKRDRHSVTRRGLSATETQIQKAFVAAFDRLAGSQAFMFSVPNERNSSAENMARLKSMGLRPGCPDIWIVWCAGSLALEFKSRRGRLSENQQAMHAHLNRLGVPVEVVRSVDDAWGAMLKHGCPVRALI